MKSMNICVDIDGTVTEPNYWLSEANRYFNENLKSDDISRYDIAETYGVAQCDYDCFYRDLGEKLHDSTRIRGGAAESLHRLSGLHKIHFVTARPKLMSEVTSDWLERHDIPADSVTLLGTHHKTSRARELGCDVFLEDSLENALELADAGIRVLLIDCSYNKGPLARGITRVKDWRSAERLITGRTRKRELTQNAV